MSGFTFARMDHTVVVESRQGKHLTMVMIENNK